MIGDRSRKQELVCRKEGRPEIGAVIILISVYSTSVLPTKTFCQWLAWFYFKIENPTFMEKQVCNSIIFYFQQHKRNSILSLQSKKKVEPMYLQGSRWGFEVGKEFWSVSKFKPPSHPFCSELTLELDTGNFSETS